VHPRAIPDIPIIRRRDSEAGDQALARAVRDGMLVRVVPGSSVPVAAWAGLPPMDRHLVRVIEAVDRSLGRIVVSHHAAAAVWGIDVLGGWPVRIDTTVPRRSGGRGSGVFARHTLTASDVETVPWRGHELTTPAQTALDLARTIGFTRAVSAVDQVRWGARTGGPLATDAAIERLRAHAQARRGDPRARRVLAFSTDLSDSVRESQSRVLLHQLGFPRPELQHGFRLPDGRRVRSDFWFPEFDHVGEFDGLSKYLDPAMTRGRTAADVLAAEKDRGDKLARLVRRISRWRTPDLEDPRRLYDILTGDGLPSPRPRPPRGLVLP